LTEETRFPNTFDDVASTIHESLAPGDIKLQNISFAFPTRPNANVLDGVSLTLPQGQVTALVGSSGAAGPARCRLPRHRHEVKPSFLQLNGMP